MRQTFHRLTSPDQGALRLPLLRRALATRGLDGYFVPHSDEYQNEYLPPRNERLAWLTGFSGSAGACVVLADHAFLFIDGRYTIQAREDTDASLFDYVDLVDPGVAGWMRRNLASSAKIGFDPKLVTIEEARKLEEAAKAADAVLQPVDDDLVAALWENRPEPSDAPLVVHPFGGKKIEDKLANIADAVKDAKADAVVLTSPLSPAWLFNLRGADIAHTPIAMTRAIVRADGRATLFVDPDKVNDAIRAHLGETVALRAEGALSDALTALGQHGETVLLDPFLASRWTEDQLSAAGAIIVHAPDPCALPRACKNAQERDGARAAHRRDGVAVTRFLKWLSDEAPKGGLDEITVAQSLEAFREETGALKDISFPTISASAGHAAMPHYRVNEESNLKIAADSVFLIDSGGQYEDGTTDITRTVAIGDPPADARRHFTLVLKGHIALSTARFPKGTTGSALDVLARQPLWEAGLDYDHGTGHGVGAYLSVHEGPARIAKPANSVALQPGMILSNEPGFYREGAYGIRIENLELVTEPQDVSGGDRPMMRFETLTLAPIDLAMVERTMLTDAEAQWLDDYHAWVRETLTPLLDADTAAWLAEATRAIA